MKWVRIIRINPDDSLKSVYRYLNKRAKEMYISAIKRDSELLQYNLDKILNVDINSIPAADLPLELSVLMSELERLEPPLLLATKSALISLGCSLFDNDFDGMDDFVQMLLGVNGTTMILAKELDKSYKMDAIVNAFKLAFPTLVNEIDRGFELAMEDIAENRDYIKNGMRIDYKLGVEHEYKPSVKIDKAEYIYEVDPKKIDITPDKWLNKFGKNAPQDKVMNNVKRHGNHLWHLFSYELVPRLSGDEARAAFDKLDWTHATLFSGGYVWEGSDKFTFESLRKINKLSADEVDYLVYGTRRLESEDVYITAEDYSWTYVVTHELDWCGPYFCSADMLE